MRASRGSVPSLRCLFMIAALSFCLSNSILAADGDLDLSFDTDGKVITDISGPDDQGIAVAIQSDGKIVVAGVSNNDFALTRYNSDGSLDSTFSGDGIVTTNITGLSNDTATAVAIQPDGKIVAAGVANGNFALARYNSDGSLDTTFSSDGIVTTTFFNFSTDLAHAVAIQTDGKIVAAGMSNGNFALARYNSDGSLDTSFSGDGKATTTFTATSIDVAYDVALQTDGKIVSAGFTLMNGNYNFALARHNPDGSLDRLMMNDFSGAGSVDVAYAVALEPNGKIVAAGYTNSGQSDFALIRYYPDFRLDKTFSGDGKVTTDFSGSGSVDVAYAVAPQADGRIVVAGSSFNGVNNDFALACYNANGSLNGNFSGDGLVTTFFGVADDEDVARSVAIEAAGEIVAVGSYNNSDFALARYIVDAPVAKNNMFPTPRGTTLNLPAPGVLWNDTDPDGDALSAILQSGTSNGSLTLNPDGSFTYTPNAGYNGPEIFTYVANDGTENSNVATVLIVVGCLLCDDFEDGVLDPTWEYSDPSWTEDSGFLIADPINGKSTALGPIIGGTRGPIIGGTRQTATVITAGGANNKIWMLGWYVDAQNTMELLIKEENDKVILKQRVNGLVVQKAKASLIIDPNTPYFFEVVFDGSQFTVSRDGSLLFTMTPVGTVPDGTVVGFQVKNTTGFFDDISVF